MPDRNATVSHERTDVSTLGVIAAVFTVFAGTLAVVFALWFYFNWERQGANALTPRSGVAPAFSQTREPLLQTSPPAELKALREYEEKVLQGGEGVAMPIDNAMRLLEDRGIAPRPADPLLHLTPPSTGHRQPNFEERVR